MQPGTFSLLSTSFVNYTTAAAEHLHLSISPASLLQQDPDVAGLLPSLFGFLRVIEFANPSDTQYDMDCHIGIDNISIDSGDNSQLLKVTLKQSKTYPIMWVLNSTLGLQEQSYVQ